MADKGGAGVKAGRGAMGTQVQAIETRYAGCNFRSRLEARWAVFFDALGVPWEYEPEGYELPSGRYLPDFWLPSIETWYEVKGQRPSDLEATLASELATHTGHRALIAFGQLPVDPDHSGQDFTSKEGGNGAHDIWLNGAQDYDYAWCVCPRCGKVGCEYAARGARVCGDGCLPLVDDRGHTGDNYRILLALKAGRSARFEFGQTPARASL